MVPTVGAIGWRPGAVRLLPTAHDENFYTDPKPRGIALIIVMIAIFVLSVMAAIFATSMKVETKLAQNADHDQQLLWLGRSGVELARYVLSEQMTIPNEPYDALNQIWAGGPGGIGESNSPLTGLSLDNYQVGDGSVSVKIVDLERKVNINTVNHSRGVATGAHPDGRGRGRHFRHLRFHSGLDWPAQQSSSRRGRE